MCFASVKSDSIASKLPTGSLGFRVVGVRGLGVKGLGVQGSGVEGAGVKGLKFMVLGLRFRDGGRFRTVICLGLFDSRLWDCRVSGSMDSGAGVQELNIVQMKSFRW